jgi:hypothetical protein
MHHLTKLILCLVITNLMAWPASAHHSDKMFDRNNPVTVKGIVTEFQFTNPHAWLILDVENEDGTVTTWGFEAGAPSNLLRANIRPGDLLPGTLVTITGYPMHDGRPAAEWIVAVLEDGRELDPESGFHVR